MINDREFINDPEFMRAVRWEVDGLSIAERILFFDNDNQIRHAVYPSEFSTGSPHRIRKELDERGVLKGVVHVNVQVTGNTEEGYGERTSVIEYLPDQSWNTLVRKPQPFIWEDDPQAIEIARALFKDNEK